MTNRDDKIRKIASRAVDKILKDKRIPYSEWDEYYMPMLLAPDLSFLAGHNYAIKRVARKLNKICKDKALLKTLLQEIRK